MRHPPTTYSNGTSNVVVDEYGSGRHAFWDGSPVMWDVSLGVNGDATEIAARWCNDVTLALKNACIEGNGAPGPAGDDVTDDRFELARAVNSAANVLTGTSNFVASGLRFTTNGGHFNVTLSEGRILYGGRKYVVTAAKLNDIDVVVNGAAAGTGNAFTVIASRDHYISIGPLADDAAETVAAMGSVFSITVTDVANGAAAPVVPAGHFVFAMLRTDGSGVASEWYRAFPRVVTGDFYGWEFMPADSYNGAGRMIPLASSTDIGSNLAPSDHGNEQESGGRLVGTVYCRSLHQRDYGTAGRLRDRWVPRMYTTTTSGAAASNVNVFDLNDLPNSSQVTFTVTVNAWSDLDQGYSRVIMRQGRRNSAAAVTLAGADVYLASLDPDTIGCTATMTVSGSTVRVTCTGAGGHDITWQIRVETLELRGAP